MTRSRAWSLTSAGWLKSSTEQWSRRGAIAPSDYGGGRGVGDWGIDLSNCAEHRAGLGFLDSPFADARRELEDFGFHWIVRASGSVHCRRNEYARAALRTNAILYFVPRDDSLRAEPVRG